jgi:hypothetical protein
MLMLFETTFRFFIALDTCGADGADEGTATAEPVSSS